MIAVIPYTNETKDWIRLLNYEWLGKYFRVEPNDVIQLSDPQGEIIDKGGQIFYALYNGNIAGTSSLMKAGDDVYELAKMAVTETYKGKGIGNVLIEFCIAKAKEAGAKKLILYSNTKLAAAISLYRKYGFYEIPMGDSHYERSDIKMEKVL